VPALNLRKELTDDELRRLAAADLRYVHSAGCSWHGSIWQAGRTTGPHGISLPSCPYCDSPSFELPTEEEWNAAAVAHEMKGHRNYVEFLAWTRRQNRCWPSLREASAYFTATTGKRVVWDL
jgi:hypothetical protein